MVPGWGASPTVPPQRAKALVGVVRDDETVAKMGHTGLWRSQPMFVGGIRTLFAPGFVVGLVPGAEPFEEEVAYDGGD
jgi:hypothetical protein